MTQKAKLAVVTLLFVGLPGLGEAQNLREMAREWGMRNPGAPLGYPAPPADYAPKTIEALAREADVVLQARLSKYESRLGENEDRILTDYRILVPRLLSGRLANTTTAFPGEGVQLLLTVLGGDVVVEGVTIHGTDGNRQAIKEDGQYLLFLMASRRREPGRYEIYNGGIFEIAGGEVKPLLKSADHVFKNGVETRLDDMITRIQTAVHPR
jgi:hypothetical protein